MRTVAKALSFIALLLLCTAHLFVAPAPRLALVFAGVAVVTLVG